MLNNKMKQVHFKSPELELKVLRLYSGLQHDEQLLAFRQPIDGIRWVILATNIGETSVTVPGVKYVIDSGLAKIREYHCVKGIDTLLARPIARS